MMENFPDSFKEETIDIKAILFKYLNFWPWFVLSVMLCMPAAWLFNKMTMPVYQVNASVLLQDEQSMMDSKFTANLGLGNQYKIPNEIGILKSQTITKRALDRLDFTVSYFEKTRFSATELYKFTPFQVVMDSSAFQPVGVEIQVEWNEDSTYTLKLEAKQFGLYNYTSREQVLHEAGVEIEQTLPVDSVFRSSAGSFHPRIKKGIEIENLVGRKFYFVFHTPAGLVRQYRDFAVSEIKNSSIVTISAQGNNVLKITDFLNALTKVFLEKGLEKKYQVAVNTISFIDNQLDQITDSLHFSERELQDFRVTKQVLNMDFQAQQVYMNMESLQNQRAELIVKGKYYEYLKENIRDNKDLRNLVLPSSIGVQDNSLNNLVNELIKLYTERADIMVNSKRENPYLTSVDQRIQNLRVSLADNVDGILQANRIALRDIDRRIGEFNERINRLPETQRQLFGYERKFRMNDALYTYLLTRRSEVMIAKASYVPDNEILDEADPRDFSLIAPKSRVNYMLAFFIAMGLPFFIIVSRDFLRNTVQADEDLQEFTDFPLLGHISRNKDEGKMVAFEDGHSPVSESFRAVRANFQFVGTGKGSQSMVITSSTTGEGKSFISINLARCFSLYNKKTVLLSFDLRKPRVHQYLGIDNEVGLSNYLSGRAEFHEIIKDTGFDNFKVITAGPVPPNPSELIASERTTQLFEYLKANFDYVIVDTPPVGIVSDALMLFSRVQTKLFVVRHGYTHKKLMQSILSNLSRREIRQLNLVVNDIPPRKGYGSYTSYYGYGYGYSYYQDKKNSGMPITRFFKKVFSS